MSAWFGRVSFTPATRVMEFADHLRAGRLMASRCLRCGARAFPPRADCEHCLSPDFEFVRTSGRGVLHTYTRIVAAPAGFEAVAPYLLGVVDLEDGGRVLARFDPSIAPEDVRIGMPLQIVPRILENHGDARVEYRFEFPAVAQPEPPGASHERAAPVKGRKR